MALKLKRPSPSLLKAGAVLLVLSLAGWGGWKACAKKKAGPGGEESAFAVAEKGDLEHSFQEIGDLAAKTRIDLASKVSGRVIELFVNEGDVVKKGQRIAVVQPGKTGAEKFLPSTVEAPIEGTVLAYLKTANEAPKFVEIGDYVTGLFESQTPTYLMTLADMRKVIVELKINEMDILKLSEGMAVEVTVDALPGEKFPAKVSMVSPRAQTESRGGKIFRVEVELEKVEPRLRSGMTARVKALLEKKEGVLKLPIGGLFEEKGKKLVYLEVPGGRPVQTAVETGLRTETEIEIVSGLEEGQRTLTEKPVDFEPLAGLDKNGGKPADANEARSSRRRAGRMRRAGG